MGLGVKWLKTKQDINCDLIFFSDHLLSPVFSCQRLSSSSYVMSTSFFLLLTVFLLSSVGWGVDQGVGGFGDDPGIKAQILNLIRSVRTVMRGWKNK